MIHVEVLSTVMKVKMANSKILSFNNRKNSVILAEVSESEMIAI